MKKSIILVLAVSAAVMALVSCASNSYVDPFRAGSDTTTPEAITPQAQPPPDHISGM